LCHGMNVQVIAGLDGTILWRSGALPGRTHDLTAARVWNPARAGNGRDHQAGRQGLSKAPRPASSSSRTREATNPSPASRPTARTPSCADPVNERTPSSKADGSSASSDAASKAGHLVKAIAVLQNYEVTRGRERAIVTADQLGMIGVPAIA